MKRNLNSFPANSHHPVERGIFFEINPDAIAVTALPVGNRVNFLSPIQDWSNAVSLWKYSRRKKPRISEALSYQLIYISAYAGFATTCFISPSFTRSTVS